MNLKLTVKTIKTLKEKGFASKYLDGAISWSSDDKTVEIDSDRLEPDFIDALQDMAREGVKTETGFNAILQQISMLKSIYKDVNSVTPKRLDQLREALKQYIKNDGIDYWIYCFEKGLDGLEYPLPAFVLSIYYKPSEKESPAYVSLEYRYISENSLHKKSIMWHQSDIGYNTVQELLEKKGFYKENQVVRDIFYKHYEKFLLWSTNYGQQYKSNSTIKVHSGWGGEGNMVLSANGDHTNLVNDMDIVSNTIPSNYVSSSLWSNNGESEDRTIPTHPNLYVFSLKHHKNFWIHTEHMNIYQYRPEVKEKLILPPKINKLIDILSLDARTNFEDIIEGKTGGTIIICKGIAGVGKTLSAEVYAEVIGKPLYKVQSDQLGIDIKDLEKNLESVLKRAQRWGAILLIDEADVYIQSRDQDLHKNAVVCTFLRVLEYYNGLLFLTTNRASDIDDAILSRATAIVEYTIPEGEELKRLWEVLFAQYNVETDELDAIIEHFVGITGRSIKNICKLTRKYYGLQKVTLGMLKDIEGYIYINKI